jgi:hypothetical protein
VKEMKRFQGLIKETWWLWLVLLTVGTILSFTVSIVFLATFPISFFSFIYFGMLRYDEDGNAKDGL